MKYILLLSVVFVLAAGCFSCQKEAALNLQPKALFDSIPSIVTVMPLINEASGIADSKKNPGYLWVQEDGGNPTQLYLLKHNGEVEKKVFIEGITNRDWEDICLVGTDLYIGEIGDNNGAYSEYAFYRFSEPSATTDTIRIVDTIRFRYSDGSHDAEAFFVDPTSNAIYIITKRDNPSRLFKLTPPFSQTTANVAQPVGQLTYSGVVGAAISSDRKELLVKTYFEIGHYAIGSGESIDAALAKSPVVLPYIAEPQGEAVCFAAGNNGYFTLSEKGFAADVKLYFYKRK